MTSHHSPFFVPVLHNSRLISIIVLLFSGDFVLWISSYLYCQTIFVVNFVKIPTVFIFICIFERSSSVKEEKLRGCRSCCSSLPVRSAPLAPFSITKSSWSEWKNDKINEDGMACAMHGSIEEGLSSPALPQTGVIIYSSTALGW